MNSVESIKALFISKGLKVTLQRIAVYQAMEVLGHACPEAIITEIHKVYPTITIATIYNVLECLVENKILTKVMTGDNKMYFDIRTDEHHHLYSAQDHRIEDFDDPLLMEMIRNYLCSKKMDDFELEEIKVQLVGKFKNKTSKILYNC
ncbi:MAG: transcriptional repressor [Candidatus Symbiothrix sp.]|jgi:Fur family peroxide stress response transcriptional regulator|nr:transcriptional repressor [Candidatus Symbiothrix sp.]